MISLLEFLPAWQNFKAELDRAKTHSACLPDETKGTPRREQCDELLKHVETALARRYPPQLFIWLTFHEFYQNLLWLQSGHELLQQWLTLRDRVQRVDGAERGTWTDDYLKSIDADVNTAIQDDKRSAPARAQLRTLRKFLDDRTDSALWQTQALQEALAAIIILLAVLLVILSIILSGRPTPAPVELVPTLCAAMLGGTLSTLLALRDGDGKGPPIFRTYWPRPVIAAAAGLLLWLVMAADAIHVVPVAAYALAIGFGFSERLFISALQKLSGEAESQIAKVSGFGNSNSK